MGRLRKKRKRFRDWSLRAAFSAYTLAAFALASLACALMVTGLEHLRMNGYALEYWDRYREYAVPDGGSCEMWADAAGVHYRILDAGGAEVALAEADGVTARVALGYADGTAQEPNLISVVPLMDEGQRSLSVALTAASVLCFPLCYGGGAALCAALFYRRKLREPIALLDMASQKIAKRDLDFAIHWDRRDEMGALCRSFEQMRRALAENNRAMWRQMEERKRLNAAFAHDLRTPLTVLRGYTGMLARELAEGGDPAEAAREVRAMEAQVRRSRVTLGELGAQLQSEAQVLLGEGRTASVRAAQGEAEADVERLMQVYDNLLSNAARYAASHVDVALEREGASLVLTVQDDGPGFTQEGLRRAGEPFYRGGADGEGHLGLGLNICRVLCEGTGGDLSVSNAPAGGARVRARFFV